MDEWISVIPIVKALRLRNVGVWRQASFEFSPGINLITGNSGSGRSIILHVLRPTESLPTARLESPQDSSVEIDYTSSEFHYGVSGVTSH